MRCVCKINTVLMLLSTQCCDMPSTQSEKHKVFGSYVDQLAFNCPGFIPHPSTLALSTFPGCVLKKGNGKRDPFKLLVCPSTV